MGKGWEQLYKFFSRRAVYHSLLWLSYLTLLIVAGDDSGNFWFTLSNNLVRLLFFAAAVYFNLLYLIPQFLAKKRFLLYFLYLLLTAVVITPLEVFVLYVKMIGSPQSQAALLQRQVDHFIFVFFILGFATLAKITKEWLLQQRIQSRLERQNMQSELRFLRSQINPHFLFNTLNSLYALTLKKSDQAPAIVLRLSEMMRYMLYECNERQVPLLKEVKYIQNYLELERIRHGAKADIQFTLENTEIEAYRIAPLMFIPFLENSFKHGLSNQIDSGFVHIRLNIVDNTVDFNIENSKPSLRDPHYHQGGIGLKNVRRRLDILYPNAHDLHIEDRPSSYYVHLKIHLDV